MLTRYTRAADIWSVGILMYALSERFFPFAVNNLQDLRNIRLQGRVHLPFRRMSDQARGLVMRMIEVDPDRRITAQQALRCGANTHK